MRTAVIGATGFIGSHLTERLVRDGATVLAIARSGRRLSNLQAVAGEHEFRACDILDRESICAALREFRPEVVFHLAAGADAQESFSHMACALASNAIGTGNALEAASRAQAGVFVYADSCKVYGNGEVPYRLEQPEAPVCSYAIGKSAGWRLCRLASTLTGMAVCGLRATFVYGPRQNPNLITHVRDCARLGRPVRLMGGSQTRDLLYVDDAVCAFLAAAHKSAAHGRTIPVGGGHELSVVQICRQVLRALGQTVDVVPDAVEVRLTEIRRSYCDNADAAELLGWRPAVSLEEGLLRTVREPDPDPEPVTAGSMR